MNSQRSDEEILTSGLKLLAEEMASVDAPPEMEQKLRAAFRARAVFQRRSNSRYWLAAVAAILLVVMGVIALRWRTDQPQQIRSEHTAPTPIIEEPRPAVVEAPKTEEVVAAEKPRRRNVRRRANSAVANHVNREIATDFMPLGYLNPATLQDGGQIIRVEVPRSTLVNFGLPVNMDRYNEKVKADVLLGVDGMARAIRFVQ
jgi:hypothetical protein